MATSFMRVKNFIKEVYNYDGAIVPKKLTYKRGLCILAEHAGLSVD